MIWKRQVHKHKTLCYGLPFRFNILIIYAARTIFIGNTAFGGPSSIKVYYTIFLVFHIILATVGGVLGLIQIILAFKDKLHIHRKIGPWASIIFLPQLLVLQFMYCYIYCIQVEKQHHCLKLH